MKKNSSGKKVWTKPKLKRIGEIRNVSGPSGVCAQAGGGGQNRS